MADDDIDLSSLVYGDEPTAQEKAAAYVKVLQGRQAQARNQSDLGMVASLVGGNHMLNQAGGALMGQGNQQYDDAAKQQQELSQTLGQRLKNSLEKQRMAAEQQRLQTDTDYRNKEIGLRQEQVNQGKFVQGAQGVINTRTGELAPYTAQPGAGSAVPPKIAEAEFGKLADALSTTKGRGNLNAERQKRLDAAERLEALVLKGGQIQNLTPQQVREAATSLGSLIGGGNSAALGQVEELTPNTLAGKFAGLKQKILNEPQGADAQAFLQNMLETAGRETGVTRHQIQSGQLAALPNFAHLRGVNKARYESILRGQGIDPATVDGNGLPVAQGAPPSSGGGGSGAAGGLVHVSYKGKTLAITQEHLAAALKDGATEVK